MSSSNLHNQSKQCRQRNSQLACRAAAATDKLDAQALEPSDFIQDRMAFLRRDLTHLFDDQGIDKSAYEEKVNFQDPITSHSSLTGYLLNIQFLRFIFGPQFILHDLRRTAENEITSRWTMRMQLTVNQISPLRKWWDPELLFTGVSIMTLNPDSGKFVSHIDYWDAIENQKFLSWEGVRHVFGQLTTLSQAPKSLDTPDYLTLRKFADCEVRRYEPFTVAETDMAGGGSSSSAASSNSNSDNGSSSSKNGPRVSAFRSLAGYIFGGNASGEKMQMTTPVFTATSTAGSSEGRMQFVISKAHQDVSELPSPNDSRVQLQRQPGGHYVVVSFSGVADEQRVQQELQRLRAALPKHGLKAKSSEDYLVARYNDPGTKPIFRRNDVLVELEDFSLW